MNASEAIGTKRRDEYPELLWSGYSRIQVGHYDRTLLYYIPEICRAWDYVSAYYDWGRESLNDVWK